MDVFFWILRVLFTVWMLGCPLLCLYWVFRPPDYFWAEHRRISSAIYVCAFLGFWAIITTGVKLYMWFIPDNWTYETDEGEIKAVRWSIASILGFAITCCLTTVLEKVCLQKHQEQTEEKIAWDIERNKRNLDSEASESNREKILETFRKEKASLEELNWQNKLTPIQDRKLRVLQGLFDELDESMESA